jgi:ATP-dependent 26S proteasome regulatory subunit
MNDMAPVDKEQVDIEALFQQSNVGETMAALDNELVGLQAIKTRIREISALLLIERARRMLGLQAEPPSLHMCFTGNPGTGKTTVAQRMADILHRLGYIRRSHVVTVSRDDLVGQYIGHTAPKTKEVLKKAKGVCYLSTRHTISTGPRTSETTDRKRSKFCSRLWSRIATTWW